jgi:hypothetical protein
MEMLILGIGVIVFLVLSVATASFAGVLLVIDCNCIDTRRLMGVALMFAGASNICFFGGLVEMRKKSAPPSSV